MYALSGQELLQIWEQGQRQHSLERALTMLALVFPAASRDELVMLSIGQRDAHLLSIHEHTFGTRLIGQTQCPNCAERLEFALQTTDLRATASAEPAQRCYQLAADNYLVQFRVPNSLDLAAIVTCHEVHTARQLLLRRCVVQATHNEDAIAPETLPETIVSQIAALMDAYDPQAETLSALTCSACGHHWSAIFDIIPFLWGEINAQAQRLLREIHTLAQAYGWPEQHILSMSAIRRLRYLEMVTV